MSEEAVERRLKEVVIAGETKERSAESFPRDRDIIDEIDVRVREEF